MKNLYILPPIDQSNRFVWQESVNTHEDEINAALKQHDKDFSFKEHIDSVLKGVKNLPEQKQQIIYDKILRDISDVAMDTGDQEDGNISRLELRAYIGNLNSNLHAVINKESRSTQESLKEVTNNIKTLLKDTEGITSIEDSELDRTDPDSPFQKIKITLSNNSVYTIKHYPHSGMYNLYSAANTFIPCVTAEEAVAKLKNRIPSAVVKKEEIELEVGSQNNPEESDKNEKLNTSTVKLDHKILGHGKGGKIDWAIKDLKNDVTEETDGVGDLIKESITKENILGLLESKAAQQDWTTANGGKPGNSPRYVLAVQAALTMLKLKPGKIDALWGTETQKALSNFQKTHKLSPANGIPNKDTILKLYDVLKNDGRTDSEEISTEQNEENDNKETQKLSKEEQKKRANTTFLERSDVQSLLKNLTDQNFTKDEEKVEAIQKMIGEKADGWGGKNTIMTLNTYLKKQNNSSTTNPSIDVRDDNNVLHPKIEKIISIAKEWTVDANTDHIPRNIQGNLLLNALPKTLDLDGIKITGSVLMTPSKDLRMSDFTSKYKVSLPDSEGWRTIERINTVASVETGGTPEINLDGDNKASGETGDTSVTENFEEEVIETPVIKLSELNSDKVVDKEVTLSEEVKTLLEYKPNKEIGKLPDQYNNATNNDALKLINNYITVIQEDLKNTENPEEYQEELTGLIETHKSLRDAFQEGEDIITITGLPPVDGIVLLKDYTFTKNAETEKKRVPDNIEKGNENEEIKIKITERYNKRINTVETTLAKYKSNLTDAITSGEEEMEFLMKSIKNLTTDDSGATDDFKAKEKIRLLKNIETSKQKTKESVEGAKKTIGETEAALKTLQEMQASFNEAQKNNTLGVVNVTNGTAYNFKTNEVYNLYDTNSPDYIKTKFQNAEPLNSKALHFLDNKIPDVGTLVHSVSFKSEPLFDTLRACKKTANNRVKQIIENTSAEDWDKLVDRNQESISYQLLQSLFPNNKALLDQWILANLPKTTDTASSMQEKHEINKLKQKPKPKATKEIPKVTGDEYYIEELERPSSGTGPKQIKGV